MALDDPRAKEWAKELGPAIVTAQEARINALEEAAKIAELYNGKSLLAGIAIAEAIRAAK
jgi:hypothetical protein